MSNRIVAFRVDGSHTIGGGHVMRCLTLAETLRARGQTALFLCRELPGAPLERIAARGFRLLRHSAPDTSYTPTREDPSHAVWAGVSWSQDAAETAAALASVGYAVDWLVLDHYAFDARWIAAVKPSGRAVLVIDDLDDRTLQGDLLLNQSMLEGRPTRPGPARALVGPRFALLRPEFAAQRTASLERRRRRSATPRLLISTGLMDVGGATLMAAEGLAAGGRSGAPRRIEIDVAIGAGARTAPALRALHGPGLSVHLDANEMASLMREADLAIGAAGATSWERLAMGLPSLVFTLADNQAAVADALAAAGAAVALGWPRPDAAQRLIAETTALLSDQGRLEAMSSAAAALCDGYGADRVADVMREIALSAPDLSS